MPIKLQKEFLKEAKSSPKLFRDLAKVEQYIAESYKTRAFVELIQNADDAGASNFGITDLDNGFVVANNGHPFTAEDVEALCRSGSSNKQRGGRTIGYRGIGFKSVVNLADRVSIISGDYCFYFDKSSTKRLLETDFDVPLIRIPHPYSASQRERIKTFLSDKKYEKFNTFFIFQQINQRLSSEEMKEFDSSSLLFLNNIRYVEIFSQGISRKVSLAQQSNTNIANTDIIKIVDTDIVSTWQIISSSKLPMVRVAFKKEENIIVPAKREESIIHSFTPTVEFAGAYIKINGDFTTDPSRKNIDFDDFSRTSFSEAVSIIARTIVEILGGNTKIEGFFAPFVNVATQENNKSRALLFRSCRDQLAQRDIQEPDGSHYPFMALRLRPNWLNFEDYQNICTDDIYPIPKSMIVIYPEIEDFLSTMHCPIMTLNEVISRINMAELTVVGCGQIFMKLASQLIYDLDEKLLAKITNLKIFPIKGKRVTAQNVASTKELRSDFWKYITSGDDSKDIEFLLRKLGVEIVRDEPENKKSPPKPSSKNGQTFGTMPQIKKWRSAEKNAAIYLESVVNVLRVADVSKANLGYDLEVFLQNGSRIFVEVKSVSNYRETIRLTNNEYSSAHQYADKYYFAIVLNSDEFELKLVRNPVNTLALEKKCERWTWVCDTYEDWLQDIKNINFDGGI